MVSQLFRRPALLRRPGRVDIDSKEAAVDPSGLGVNQLLQRWLDQARGVNRGG